MLFFLFLSSCSKSKVDIRENFKGVYSCKKTSIFSSSQEYDSTVTYNFQLEVSIAESKDSIIVNGVTCKFENDFSFHKIGKPLPVFYEGRFFGDSIGFEEKKLGLISFRQEYIGVKN